MDLKDIKKIVELMDEHELSFFHLEKEDFNLKLKKGMDAEAIMAAMPAPAQMAAPLAAAPVAASEKPAAVLPPTTCRNPRRDKGPALAGRFVSMTLFLPCPRTR